MPVSAEDAHVGAPGLGLVNTPLEKFEIIVERNGGVALPSKMNIREKESLLEQLIHNVLSYLVTALP